MSNFCMIQEIINPSDPSTIHSIKTGVSDNMKRFMDELVKNNIVVLAANDNITTFKFNRDVTVYTLKFILELKCNKIECAFYINKWNDEFISFTPL